ncbi:hypothetical protein KXV63_003861 [Aspergillus fumigatus]|nr:hypothetical protein KXV63_003861 [Aspergillus fumigatus]
MSTPSRARHSHGGCWTCKAKHRKCDCARPTCQACTDQGIPCDGYEVRLRWGSGIASRGRYAGAEAPVDTSIPLRVPGRRRDRIRARRAQQEGEIRTQVTEVTSSQDYAQEDSRPSPASFSFSSPGHSKDDEQLFQDFHDEQILLKLRLPALCQKSEALYRICIALQASLSGKPAACSLEYLEVGLNKFRAELSESEGNLEDGTLTAGLLLCTIGVMHGIPWTMHLRGMYTILRMHDVEGPQKHQERGAFRAHLFEVMGIMDLPTFSIGRRHPHLGFWRRYCSPWTGGKREWKIWGPESIQAVRTEEQDEETRSYTRMQRILSGGTWRRWLSGVDALVNKRMNMGKAA